MRSTWWSPEVDKDAARLISINLQAYALFQALIGIVESSVKTHSLPFWPTAESPNGNVLSIVVIPLTVVGVAQVLQRCPAKLSGPALIVLLPSGAGAVAAISIHSGDASVIPAVSYLIITVTMAYIWPRRQAMALAGFVCAVIFVNAYYTETDAAPFVRAVMLSFIVAGSSWGIASARDSQRRDTARLRAASRQDSLTGLTIRWQVDEALKRAAQQPFPADGHSLLLIDIDGFKQINDTQGHPFGDAVLRQLGAHMLALANPTDMPFRLGGDELGVFRPGVGEAETRAFATELQTRLSATPLLTSSGENLITRVSFGCAHAASPGEIGTLYPRCDRELYEAKRKIKECNRQAVDPHLRFFVDVPAVTSMETP